ncbi:MAG: hypothetical protein ABI488_04775 [Polyangiaceae bacterium]
MNGRRWAFLGLLVLSAGCSSGGSDSGGGGSAGSSGAPSGAGGGAAGSPSNTAGSAGGPSGLTGLGTVGTGAVACSGVSGDSCPAGSVCCVRFPSADNTCEASYAACTNGRPLGCDDPTDCTGQKCCARPVPGVGVATYYGSGCKAACDPATDRIICATTADCAGTGACMQSATSFMACL